MDRYGQYSDVASSGVSTDAGNAYAAGDLIGGKLTLNIDRFLNQAAARFGQTSNTVRTGIVRNVTVIDQARQAAELDLLLFESDPASTTFTANAALNVASIDMAKIVGKVSVGSTDYVNVASGSIATKSVEGLVFRTEQTSGNLFAALLANGTPTYPGSADLGLRIGVEQH